MFSNSLSVYFSLCFHVWRTNSVQNIHVNYVWYITLVLLMFLMCFTLLVLGGKSCNHLSTLCFFFDCILIVFWLYFDCILYVFWLYLYQTWFHCTRVVSHCIGDQQHMCHTFWWPRHYTKTLYLQKFKYIFCVFSITQELEYL